MYAALLLIGGVAGYFVGRSNDHTEIAAKPPSTDSSQAGDGSNSRSTPHEARKVLNGLNAPDSDRSADTSLLDEELEQLSAIRSLDRDALVALIKESTIAGPKIGWAIRRLAELDPDTAIALVVGDQKFERWVFELFASFSRINLERGLTLVEQLPSRLQQSAASGLLAGVPAMDLEDFLALQKRLPQIGITDSTLAGWADRMMETDPERGWRQLLAQGLSNVSDRSNFSIYTYVWFLNDPLTALDAITSTENPARDDAITLLKSSLGGTNAALVVDWLSRQDRKLQDDLMPDLLGQYAQIDAHAALKLAANLPRELTSTAERNIIRNWASSDPRAAIEWVLEDRQHQDQAERLADVARTYAFHKPADAIEWATSITEPALREAALESIARTGASPYLSPETAIAAAAAMVNSDNRTRLARATYASWQKHDETGAKKGIRAHFSGTELAVITAPFDK